MTNIGDLKYSANLGGFIKEKIQKADGSITYRIYKLIEIAGKGMFASYLRDL